MAKSCSTCYILCFPKVLVCKAMQVFYHHQCCSILIFLELSPGPKLLCLFMAPQPSWSRKNMISERTTTSSSHTIYIYIYIFFFLSISGWPQPNSAGTGQHAKRHCSRRPGNARVSWDNLTSPRSTIVLYLTGVALVFRLSCLLNRVAVAVPSQPHQHSTKFHRLAPQGSTI